MEVLSTVTRKARKRHVCDLCCQPIEKGERYECRTCKLDDVYQWKTHLRCSKLCSEIWDIVDPDEGMTSDDFRDGIDEFFTPRFCAFHCPAYDPETGECRRDKSPYECTKKIAAYMKSRTIVGNYIEGFKLELMEGVRPMTFKELNHDQRVALKQGLLTEELYEENGTEPSYAELADADKLVTDEKLEERYGRTEFVPEDFLP